MTRWAPGAAGRLQSAALELFSAQGYAATTVPQIAERAGLTTRTFFRYFADKREVLFDGDAVPDAATALLREAPEGLDALPLIREQLRRFAEQAFEGERDEVGRVRRVIEGDPALRERDQRKRADLAAAIRRGLEERGEDPLTAAVVADLAVSALHIGLDRWLAAADAPRPLADLIDEVLDRATSLRAG